MASIPKTIRKPSIAAHTADQGFKGPKVPVQRVPQRRSPSPGLRKRDYTNGKAKADDLDLETLDWFIIQVKPGKEHTARMVAREKGFGTCLPMYVSKSREGKHAPSTLRNFPVLSGYLFVGMSRDTPGWPDLMRPRFMLSVVGINDRPYQLDKCIIDQFLRRYESDFYKRREVPPPPPPDFNVGDHVRVVSGPWDQHVFPVKKMNQKQAVIVAHVLGKDCEIAIRLDDLRKSA